VSDDHKSATLASLMIIMKIPIENLYGKFENSNNIFRGLYGKKR